MIQDFRFAFRQLLKSPGFTFIAVVTLALAIGVNSAIFALINGVVLRPMVPVRPQEVVNVFTARQSANHDYRQFSHTEFRELRDNRIEVPNRSLAANQQGRPAAHGGPAAVGGRTRGGVRVRHGNPRDSGSSECRRPRTPACRRGRSVPRATQRG